MIYLLDGDSNFTELVGIVTRLAMAQRMPDAIIIAVPNTKDRTHDLTPEAASDSFRTAYQEGSPEINTRYFATRGDANKFRAFLTQELAPWVESHYRTERFRMIFGHSFGGLFVLDAISREPHAFTAYVSMSPSLWWDNGRYLETIQNGLARGPLTGKSLYITTGGRELVDGMIKPPQALAAYLQRSPPAGLRWSFRIMPGEVHSTNPHRSEYDALEWLFEGFEMNDTTIVALSVRNDTMPIVRHYAGLSRQLGYTVPYPVSMLNGRGHFYLTSKKPEHAMRLFRFNVAHAPDSPTAHGGLADGLEAMG